MGGKTRNAGPTHGCVDLTGGKTSNTGMLSTSVLRFFLSGGHVQKHWQVEKGEI